jgi:hypothetical protein
MWETAVSRQVHLALPLVLVLVGPVGLIQQAVNGLGLLVGKG